jgi:Gpi18-like mannosyltransferase
MLAQKEKNSHPRRARRITKKILVSFRVLSGSFLGWFRLVRVKEHEGKYSHFIKKPIVRIIAIFLLTRLLLSSWVVIVRYIFPFPINNNNLVYMNVPPENNLWLEPWQRWDTIHYQAIAIHGYTAFDSALFTPPLFPILIKLTTPFLAGNSLLAALLVSNIALIILLISLYRIALLNFRDDRRAYRVVGALLLYPTSFFLFAAYSEALFLLWAILAVDAIQHRYWIRASVLTGLAGLTRMPGLLLFLPLACSLLKESYNQRRIAIILHFLWGFLIFALFPLYVVIVMKKPFLAILQAVGRGGTITFPGINLFEAGSRIIKGQLVTENLLELIFTLILVLLVAMGWKKYHPVYRIYSASFLIFYLMRLGSPQPLIGMARYTLAVFPIFFTLADQQYQPVVKRTVIILALFMQLFLSGQFAIGGWVG